MFYIYLFGKPCSGKGTVANVLQEDFGFYHFKSSQLFVKVVEDVYGVESKERQMVRGGHIIDIQEVEDSVIDHITNLSSKYQAIIFDGYPRTQFQWNIQMSKFSNIPKIVIYLDVDDKVAIERMKTRYLCLFCDRYQTVSDGRDSCLYCGQKELHKRYDDKPEILSFRLKNFKEKSLNIKFEEDKKTKFYIIDVNRDLSLIITEVKSILKDNKIC